MKVFLGARTPEEAESATHELPEEGLEVVPRAVGVSEDESVGSLTDELEEFGRLDVLANNAGINFDFRWCTSNANLGMVRETVKTGLFGAWHAYKALLPLLRASTIES